MRLTDVRQCSQHDTVATAYAYDTLEIPTQVYAMTTNTPWLYNTTIYDTNANNINVTITGNTIPTQPIHKITEGVILQTAFTASTA